MLTQMQRRKLIMEKMNIKKHTYLLMCILAGALMYSCSGDESPTLEGLKQETSLSILLNAPQQGKEKSSGNPDLSAESKIYSLEVLVFKSEGESEEGKLDGYGYVARQTKNVTGQIYDKEYIEINEIKDITVTAGTRDIYVIANAPDKYFSSVTNSQDFLKKYEDLSTQGRYPYPGTTTPNADEDIPIGGINPSNLKMNLTMCNYKKNVSLNNLYDHQYLGYTTNNGRPDGVDPGQGWLLDGSNPFYIERLAARIAIRKIEFDLPASLPFEGVSYPSNDYTFQIDSVFMLNTKTTSKFAVDSQIGFAEKFGHGCQTGYSFLNNSARIYNLNQDSEPASYLLEAITATSYDISTNATPLWFYAFENESGSYPTYLVIGVRYNFKSSKDNSLNTLKCYYPVIVNQPKAGKSADHDYVKRNYQYQIAATIKGLGSMYGNPAALKNGLATDSEVEITETVGRNLFPWTGDVYK
jgi:hypothetical protein